MLSAAVVLCCASAAEAQPLTAHRTGEFQAVLTQRSPESDPSRWVESFQFGGTLDRWNYDLSAESFSFYVPPSYDPEGEPFGVVIWVSASNRGTLPEELQAVFDERRLIWIGPNQAGNARHLFQRTGLALDAAANVRELYHIDLDRIFVSGLSGGGKVAALLAIDWPEVFSGAFPIIGVSTYLPVPLESNPAQTVYRFPAPAPQLLDRARQQPFVILTGSDDFNREECMLTAAAYALDGFVDLHLVDVPGMGHEMPTAQNFARGLDLLLAASSTPL